MSETAGEQPPQVGELIARMARFEQDVKTAIGEAGAARRLAAGADRLVTDTAAGLRVAITAQGAMREEIRDPSIAVDRLRASVMRISDVVAPIVPMAVELPTRMATLEARVDALAGDMSELRSDVGDLKAGQDRILVMLSRLMPSPG